MMSEREFASPVVDLGMVVRDLEKSIEFYTEAIGFVEVMGFDVPAELAGDTGLTDYKPLEISMLKLDIDASVPTTDLKLMHVPDVEVADLDREYIHSSYGINYVSLFVSDIDSALARLERAGVKPQGKGAVSMPFEIALGVMLRPETMGVFDDGLDEMPEEVLMLVVKDPDGNFIELLGPRKNGPDKSSVNDRLIQ